MVPDPLRRDLEVLADPEVICFSPSSPKDGGPVSAPWSRAHRLDRMLLLPELSVLLRVERPLLPVLPRTPPRAPFCFSPRRLRFHRQHEFFEDGDIHRHLYLQDILTNVTEVTERSKVSEFCCHIVGCCQVFDTLEGYEHHYNTLHRNMCSFCKRSFPSGHLLDTHILEWHDSLFQIMAEKQNMYQCLVEGCTEKFKSSKDRKDHLVKVHLYPSDFRFDKPKKAKSSTKHSKPPKLDVSVPMDVNVETYEQSQLDSMEICPSESVENPTQPVSGPVSSLQEKKLYKSRIPSTICFGQGACRGFKSMKKKV